jgi:large subunit ribosomal protein L4
MMNVDILKIDGQPSGSKAKLADSVFAIEENEHAVYLTVKAQLANARQGTSSTKGRSEVRGGGRKPWKQKGRGVARAGTSRSPLWVGGGRTFGPEPRTYTQKINKKVNKLARRTLLTNRLRRNQLVVTEDFSLENGKTTEMIHLLNGLSANESKVLILTADFDKKLVRAAQNVPNTSVLRADLASAHDLIKSNHIVLQKGAIKKLEEVLA